MYKTERTHSRDTIEKLRLLALRMMLQCIVDLTYKASGLNPLETEQVRAAAMFDCFHPRGFIRYSAGIMGYDVGSWRKLAVSFLRGDVGAAEPGQRIGNAVKIVERRDERDPV
jgi:hypothetical protein